ncbi:MAG: DUF948 domain-containing protein [Thermodesulfovibrionales bacterium]|nr:DUF948 domain-containing protein [Thermodesulfovibrionales bacterium]
MVDYIWVVVVSLGFLFLIVGFLVGISILIYATLEIKKAVNSVKSLVEKIETNIHPIIDSTDSTIRGIKAISDDVKHITGNVKNLSESLTDLANNVRDASKMVVELRESLSVKGAGLKAGLKTALEVLLKQKG